MIAGYRLDVVDNDSYMLRAGLPYPACINCGFVTDREWIDRDFQLNKQNFDASYTYDGYLIVSDRFRSLAEGRGARFVRLPSQPDFYSCRVDALVRFDAVKRGTRFEDYCDVCHRYRSVAGATPVYLHDPLPLDAGFVRTDIEFGTGNERHPIILVGSRFAEGCLMNSGLTGLSLMPIEGR